MARYEASALGAEQIEWPHLFLGLMRAGRSLIQNFLGSHEAVVGLSLKIRETMPVRPKVSTSLDIHMAADCQSLIMYSAQQASGELRSEAVLEILFVSMLKDQPDWFRQFGLDSEVVAAALSYPALNLPAHPAQLAGFPAVMLQFRGVLDEMETALRPMPEARANEPITPGATWSRKQMIGFLIDGASNHHQLCIRALVSQDHDVSFPDYDPAAWVNATGFQEMPWRVLIDLCVTYHRLLYDLCNRFPAQEFSSATCRIGDRQPRSLVDLVRDYVANVNRSVRELSR
jgi:hypothetical protein